MSRILLKLSGEALAGDKHHGFDEATVIEVAKQVKQIVDNGTQVGIDVYKRQSQYRYGQARACRAENSSEGTGYRS